LLAARAELNPPTLLAAVCAGVLERHSLERQSYVPSRAFASRHQKKLLQSKSI
jgi:hypothetical protein